MTPEFRLLMKLSAAGATGRPVSPEEIGPVDWSVVYRLAQIHAVLTLAAYGLDLSRDLDCPETVRRQMTSVMLGSAARNIIKKEAIMGLLGQMEAAGIHAVLVKGYAVADCYQAPECRLSSDTDIWVDPKDEQRTCAFLEGLGFEVEPRWKNGHHAVCRHPQMGIVEVHVQLYDEIVEEVWFGKTDGTEFVEETHLRVECPEGIYITLGHTDHLLFLTLHLIKHFIISGMNLRMILDVALYMEKYRGLVDLARFWDTIRQFRYERLLQNILWIAVECFGLDPAGLPGIAAERPDCLDEILTDLEQGGSLGGVDHKARNEGWYSYNRHLLLKEKSPLQYTLYMLKWKWDLYVKAVFPTREQLSVRFPCVLEKPWTIPFVWIYRLIFRGTRFLVKSSKTTVMLKGDAVMSDAAATRVNLFRKLEMF